MLTRRPCLYLLLALTLTPTRLPAQETRREAVEQQRAARAATLAVYEPGRIERALLYVERNRIVERLSGADGLYPRIGSIQRGGALRSAPATASRSRLANSYSMPRRR